MCEAGVWPPEIGCQSCQELEEEPALIHVMGTGWPEHVVELRVQSHTDSVNPDPIFTSVSGRQLHPSCLSCRPCCS